MVLAPIVVVPDVMRVTLAFFICLVVFALELELLLLLLKALAPTLLPDAAGTSGIICGRSSSWCCWMAKSLAHDPSPAVAGAAPNFPPPAVEVTTTPAPPFVVFLHTILFG